MSIIVILLNIIIFVLQLIRQNLFCQCLFALVKMDSLHCVISMRFLSVGFPKINFDFREKLEQISDFLKGRKGVLPVCLRNEDLWHNKMSPVRGALKIRSGFKNSTTPVVVFHNQESSELQLRSYEVASVEDGTVDIFDPVLQIELFNYWGVHTISRIEEGEYFSSCKRFNKDRIRINDKLTYMVGERSFIGSTRVLISLYICSKMEVFVSKKGTDFFIIGKKPVVYGLKKSSVFRILSEGGMNFTIVPMEKVMSINLDPIQENQNVWQHLTNVTLLLTNLWNDEHKIIIILCLALFLEVYRGILMSIYEVVSFKLTTKIKLIICKEFVNWKGILDFLQLVSLKWAYCDREYGVYKIEDIKFRKNVETVIALEFGEITGFKRIFPDKFFGVFIK